jgi:hypothetical protein
LSVEGGNPWRNSATYSPSLLSKSKMSVNI